ncbi:MAG: ABC transporter permease [Acidobacteria bacterium]|nr:MAG: ABC transporter permease [Acidobacteriota bacterium]
MNKQMIIAGLKARPVRTTVSLLAVALEVVLILVVVGLTSGISDETGRRTEGVGADILLQPPNSSLFLALSNTTMPIVLRERLRELPGIKAITPVQTLVNSSAGLEIIYGIEPDTFDAVSNGFIWHKGRLFNAPDDVVVDDIYAKAKGVTVGDTVELVNHKFKVCGVVEHGKGARLFISLKTAQEMTGQTGKASLFFIKLTDPDRVETAIAEIKRLLEGYGVIPLREYARLMMSNSMPALDAFISSVVFIALCIGVLVIFLSMYTTITERTREIGILRSLGASKTFIVTLIFEESAAVCSAGALIGIGSSFLIARIIMAVFPTLTILITPDWITRAVIFALLSGIIGSLYPSLKAAKQDPVEALAYE